MFMYVLKIEELLLRFLICICNYKQINGYANFYFFFKTMLQSNINVIDYNNVDTCILISCDCHKTIETLT